MPHCQAGICGGPTFFHSADRGLHLPASLTPEAAKQEARKRRASERHAVPCYGELSGLGGLVPLGGLGEHESLPRRGAKERTEPGFGVSRITVRQPNDPRLARRRDERRADRH